MTCSALPTCSVRPKLNRQISKLPCFTYRCQKPLIKPFRSSET
uniref:Uncharacterized protein n=1 Tax=Anguilla anguilla TaxID=7936 RepID=A0A0E9WA70_ANGAN